MTTRRSPNSGPTTPSGSTRSVSGRPAGTRSPPSGWPEKHVFEGRGYTGAYEPIAIDGPFAVTHGRTLFYDIESGATQSEFDNVWVLRFAPDGRCAEFHEWYAGRPEHDPSRA